MGAGEREQESKRFRLFRSGEDDKQVQSRVACATLGPESHVPNTDPIG
jgi:hypothetical protein